MQNVVSYQVLQDEGKSSNTSAHESKSALQRHFE